MTKVLHPITNRFTDDQNQLLDEEKSKYMALNCRGTAQGDAKNFVEQSLSAEQLEKYCLVVEICRSLIRKHGIYSTIEMQAAGFHYTNEGDTACCDTCGLQVSQWTSDMKPFTVHAQRSPTCDFVLSMQPKSTKVTSPPFPVSVDLTMPSTEGEQPSKRQKTDETQDSSQLNVLVEVNMLKEVRRQTFSHYPHRSSPTPAQMSAAGFFSCNVGDRVICLYCNLICQQWKPQTDDPWAIHSTLSPKCPYVMAMKTQSRSASIPIVNEQGQTTTNANDSIRWEDIVYRAACHPNYIEMPRREASFVPWKAENMPSVEDLVRAGFFYTGTKSIVTCFYCNGSLQNWGAGDNPMIEHARWFPHCAYAKQLCGADLYRKIRDSQRAQLGEYCWFPRDE